MKQLYQDIILDHYKNPRRQGALGEFDVVTTRHNPLCGDEVTLYLKRQDTSKGAKLAVAFVGKGCAISQASASILAEYLDGRPARACEEAVVAFERVMAGEPTAAALPEAVWAITGLRDFPVRLNCATLPWVAMADALKELVGR